NRAVLVEVRELVQVPEWTSAALPCRERLKAFDECCGLIADAFQHREAVQIKFRSEKEDRELGSTTIRRGRTRGLDDEHVNRMIECRTEVMDDFSDDDAPHRRTWFFHDHSDRDVENESRFSGPVYASELDCRFVRIAVKEGSHFLLERVELIAGS